MLISSLKLMFEVVKVVVLGFFRITFSIYAHIYKKFTQKPIFNYFYYLG
jgi:hypothetical protein